MSCNEEVEEVERGECQIKFKCLPLWQRFGSTGGGFKQKQKDWQATSSLLLLIKCTRPCFCHCNALSFTLIAELISQNCERKNNTFDGGTGLQNLFIVLIKSPEKYILTSNTLGSKVCLACWVLSVHPFKVGIGGWVGLVM